MILIVADLIIGLCLFILFSAILSNFAESKNKKIVQEKRSIVETGTMTLFFLGVYLLIRFKIGEIILPESFQIVLVIIGLFMIILGTFVNVVGRFNLGQNWANQVKIYDDQTFSQKGVYLIVRHPLYASIMLMFYGACLVHPNYLAFFSVTFIFIPMMFYRARQEEILLMQRFRDYKKYREKVGMFFPKIF